MSPKAAAKKTTRRRAVASSKTSARRSTGTRAPNGELLKDQLASIKADREARKPERAATATKANLVQLCETMLKESKRAKSEDDYLKIGRDARKARAWARTLGGKPVGNR